MEMERKHQQWSWCSSPRNCKWAVRWRLVHPCRGEPASSEHQHNQLIGNVARCNEDNIEDQTV
jgi:hypothetical protein